MLTRATRMTAVLVLGIAIVLGVMAAPGRAQQSQAPGTQAQSQSQSQSPSQSRPGMAGMMKMHQQMMAEMKAGEAKLDALVKEMNAATGAAKVDAIAAVVNELVRQHKLMQGHMGRMSERMMGPGMMKGR